MPRLALKPDSSSFGLRFMEDWDIAQIEAAIAKVREDGFVNLDSMAPSPELPLSV